MPDINYTLVATGTGTVLTVVLDRIHTITPDHGNYGQILRELIGQDLAPAEHSPLADRLQALIEGPVVTEEEGAALDSVIHERVSIDRSDGSIGVLVDGDHSTIAATDKLIDLVAEQAPDEIVKAYAEFLLALVDAVGEDEDSEFVDGIYEWVAENEATVTTDGQILTTAFAITHPQNGQVGVGMFGYDGGNIVMPVNGGTERDSHSNNAVIVVSVSDVVSTEDGAGESMLVKRGRVVRVDGRGEADIEDLGNYARQGFARVSAGGTVVDTADVLG